MQKSTLREKFDRASAILANTEYSIEATVETKENSVIIVPNYITTAGLREIEKEFDSHMYSTMFGGFVVNDF